MGDRMLHRGSLAQRGASALGFDLGSELVLKLFVLTDRQASSLADPGCGTLRSVWTPITGASEDLGVFAWDHRDGLATRTRDLSVYEVEGEVVLRKARPALRSGAGNDVDALLGPLHHTWTSHVPQVDIQLQQPWRLFQRLDQQLHRFMLRLVRWADHDLARDMTIQVQHEVLLKTVERFGAALPAVPHVRILNGDAPIRGHLRLDARAPRAIVWVWFGILRDNLGDRVHDVLQRHSLLHKALVLLQPLFPASYLCQHQAQSLLSGLRLPPVEVQRGLEAAVSHQDQTRFLQNRVRRRAQCACREAHRLGQRRPKHVQGVLYAPRTKQGRGVQSRPQLPGAKAPSPLGQRYCPLQQHLVQVMRDEPHAKVEQCALAQRWLLRPETIQHHRPAFVHHGKFHGVSVADVPIGLQQCGEGQHASFHWLFAPRLRPVGCRQSSLARGIEQLMTSLAQKHKELPYFACTSSNSLFFQGQHNRRIPHAGLLQVTGARRSALYQSTGSPIMSTLDEPRPQQLISVLETVSPGTLACWLLDGHAPVSRAPTTRLPREVWACGGLRPALA